METRKGLQAEKPIIPEFVWGWGWIRTNDLRVMSLSRHKTIFVEFPGFSSCFL
jgi:hypothetical protein